MKRYDYIAPSVLRVVSVCVEKALMAGSVMENPNVKSVGQEVDTYDFSDGSFNHNWN